MAEVLDLLLSFAATTFACFYVVLRDERRLADAPERGGAHHDGAILACAQLIFWGSLACGALLMSGMVDRATQAALFFGSLGMGLGSPLAAFLVARHDAQRLTPDLLERAWPSASRAAAIVSFGQIAVWVHFWKTRRFGVLGLLLGVFWAVALTLPALAVGFILDQIFPGSS